MLSELGSLSDTVEAELFACVCMVSHPLVAEGRDRVNQGDLRKAEKQHGIAVRLVLIAGTAV